MTGEAEMTRGGRNGGVGHVCGLLTPCPQIPGCWIPASAGMAGRGARFALLLRREAGGGLRGVWTLWTGWTAWTLWTGGGGGRNGGVGFIR